MRTRPRPLLGLLLLLLVAAWPVLGQDITHHSLCHPEGSSTYPLGDTVTFEYDLEDDPDFGGLVTPPCVSVRLEAAGVQGRPPLTRHWTIDGELDLFGNPVELDTTSLAAGYHMVRFTLSNPSGSASMMTPLYVAALLEPPTQPVADEDPSPDLTVTFEAATLGAHEWRWTFGDGSGATAWMEHPCHYHASVITHTFPRPGTYPVQATARNCRDGQLTSQALLVQVGSPDAITLTRFEAEGCDPVFCVFEHGDLVTFEIEASAPPERYLWDWDGDGTVDQITASPVGHRYPEFGIFSPILTVERGSASSTLSHERLLLIQ